MQAIDLEVVFPHEQRGGGCKVGIFRDTDIATDKPAIDNRQIVAWTGLQVTVRQAQTCGIGCIRTIDLTAVDPSRDAVHRGAAGTSHEPCHRDRITRQIRITGRDGDVDVVDAVRRGQIKVMIDELSPHIHPRGESTWIGRFCFRPGCHDIADLAGIRGVDQAVGRIGCKIRWSDAYLGTAGNAHGSPIQAQDRRGFRGAEFLHSRRLCFAQERRPAWTRDISTAA